MVPSVRTIGLRKGRLPHFNSRIQASNHQPENWFRYQSQSYDGRKLLVDTGRGGQAMVGYRTE